MALPGILGRLIGRRSDAPVEKALPAKPPAKKPSKQAK